MYKKFIFYVALPLGVALVNYYLVKNKILDLDYGYLNKSSSILLSIAILGCLYLSFAYKNNRSFLALCIFSALFLILYLLVGYAISNFGF